MNPNTNTWRYSTGTDTLRYDFYAPTPAEAHSYSNGSTPKT